MKSDFIACFILTLFTITNAYEAISTALECVNCQSTGFVCKDNVVDYRSYCCSKDEDSIGCKRNYCSNAASSQSMRPAFCPFQYKICGTDSSNIAINVINTWKTLNYVSGRFKMD